MQCGTTRATTNDHTTMKKTYAWYVAFLRYFLLLPIVASISGIAFAVVARLRLRCKRVTLLSIAIWGERSVCFRPPIETVTTQIHTFFVRGISFVAWIQFRLRSRFISLFRKKRFIWEIQVIRAIYHSSELLEYFCLKESFIALFTFGRQKKWVWSFLIFPWIWTCGKVFFERAWEIIISRSNQRTICSILMEIRQLKIEGIHLMNWEKFWNSENWKIDLRKILKLIKLPKISKLTKIEKNIENLKNWHNREQYYKFEKSKTISKI